MHAYWYWPFARPEELDVARAFVERGNRLDLHVIHDRVTSFTPGAGLTLLDDLPTVPIRAEGTMKWLASRSAVYPRRAVRRARIVGAGDFDVAHIIYLNYFTDFAAVRALNRHAPTVATVHDVVPHQQRVPELVQRSLLSRQYASLNHVVVHHKSVGVRLHEEFDYPTAQIHEIPWAIPPVAAIPRPVATDNAFTLLMFGTLRRNKGVAQLLEAMKINRDPNLRLVIAGRGFADVEALALAGAEGDTRITVELGYVSSERKDTLYRAADLVVLPYTTFSSQSAVLHDAYAYATPVLVTEVGALGHSVREDDTGWVAPPNAPEALASTIQAAQNNGTLRERYSQNCATVAHARRPAVVAGLLETLYGRITHRH